MGKLDDLKTSLELEIEDILNKDFKVEFIKTDIVPSIDGNYITYPNTDDMIQKCKLIETCVLYIDIRRSTELNISHRRETVAKLYSAFVRSMAKASEHYEGKVRGIIGDRLMILFDKKDCFKNAVNTAFLFNSISQYMINKHFKQNEVACGIGIDFGNILVTKAGIKKYGFENSNYKSLVWLGRPANIASKLTDKANKATLKKSTVVIENHHYPLTNKDSSFETTPLNFLSNFGNTSTQYLKHQAEYFSSFSLSNRNHETKVPPILMTERVYNGFKRDCPNCNSIKNNNWKEIQLDIDGYNGKILGADLIFPNFKS